MKINSKKILIFVFVIISISLVAAKVKFNKLMGNVYNINDIDANIDKIKPGDTINYTGNGYSDWKVLYIDKENKTIDIITKSSVGSITFHGDEGLNNPLGILQNEANKYADGENAISARNVVQSDLDNFTYEDSFWTSDIARLSLYTSSGPVNLIFSSYDVKFLPVVTINVDDASSLNVGDEYSYELNGHSSWLILYKNSNTSISIVPKEPKDLFKSVDERVCSKLGSYIQERINEYNNSEISVRNINRTDLSALANLNSDSLTGPFYADNLRLNSEYEGMDWYAKVPGHYYYYYSDVIRRNGTYSYGINSFYSCYEYEYTLGIRPIVTIKFSDAKEEQNSLDTNLKIGDNVNYEAKGYNNWKVLSMDKSKGTVDVISGGVVKNVMYTGLDDFNDISNKLQFEADEYKSGDRVISARIVRFNDFDNLRKIKDRTMAKYWVNNTYEYRTKSNRSYYYSTTDKIMNTTTINKSVGIGYYSESYSDFKKDWAILYTDASLEVEKSPLLSPAAYGPYSYTAGIRPIITLKINQVEKVDESTVTKPNDESFIIEQNNENKSYSNLVTEKQVQESEINVLDSSSKTLNNPLNNDYITENEVDSELNKLYKKYFRKIKFVVLNLLIIDLIIIFVLSILKKRKIYNKK